MTPLPLSEIINSKKKFPAKKSFYGMGIGLDGIPIDLLKVHLLGSCIKNYNLLLADEFSSKRMDGESGLNDFDLAYATEMYTDSFQTFNKIWKNDTPILFSSDIMKSDKYPLILNNVEQKIKEIGLEEQLMSIKTERGKSSDMKRKYALNELAVIEFLRKEKNIAVKIGPPSEQKYDCIMKKISPKTDFFYLYSAHMLSRDNEETSPHLVNNILSIPNKRILITDDLDTVEEKLEFGNKNALKYFAILGSLAGRAEGKICKSSSEILKINDKKKLLEIAQSYVSDNIIAPFRRAKDISVYQKTPLRHIYDSTFKVAHNRLKGRSLNLKEEVRPELDFIAGRLLHLFLDRAKNGFNPAFYNSKFPHLSEAGISPHLVKDTYLPLLNLFCNKNRKMGLENVQGLDLELMGLIQRRILTGYDVAITKLREGISIYDGKRETAILQEISEKGAQCGLDPKKVYKGFKLLIDKTRELEGIILSRYEIDFNNDKENFKGN